MQKTTRNILCGLLAFASFAAVSAKAGPWYWNGQKGNSWWEQANNWDHDGKKARVSNDNTGHSAVFVTNHFASAWTSDATYGYWVRFGMSYVVNGVQCASAHVFIDAGTAERPLVFQCEAGKNSGLNITSYNNSKTTLNKNMLVASDDYGAQGPGSTYLRIIEGRYTMWDLKVGASSKAFPGYLTAYSDKTSIYARNDFFLYNGAFASTNATFTCDGKMYVGKKDGETTMVDKVGGTWKVAGGLYVMNAKNANASFYHRSGKTTLGNTLYIGSNASSTSSTAYMEISGGIVTNTAGQLIIGDDGGVGSKAELCVKKGGECYTATDAWVGNKAAGTLTIQGGLVDVASNVVFCSTSGCQAGEDCRIDLKSGGVLSVNQITYGSGTANATFAFDGGTVRAKKGTTLFVNKPLLSIHVGQGGGTIDTSGLNLTLGTALPAGDASAKPLRIVGGGQVTFSSATLAHPICVDFGTKLRVTSTGPKTNLLMTAGVSVTLPDETPVTGLYELITTSLSAGFTDQEFARLRFANPAVAERDGVEFARSSDKKTIYVKYPEVPGTFVWTGAGGNRLFSNPNNWNWGIAPTNGVTLAFGKAATNLVCDIDLAAAALVFMADISANSIAVDAPANGAGSLYGVGYVRNLSAKTVEFTVPVAFSGAISLDTKGILKFTGGASGETLNFFGSTTDARRAVEAGTTYRLAHWTNDSRTKPVTIKEGGAVEANVVTNLGGVKVDRGGSLTVGTYELCANSEDYVLWHNRGLFAVTNVLRNTSSAKVSMFCNLTSKYANPCDGTNRIARLVNRPSAGSEFLFGYYGDVNTEHDASSWGSHVSVFEIGGIEWEGMNKANMGTYRHFAERFYFSKNFTLSAKVPAEQWIEFYEDVAFNTCALDGTPSAVAFNCNLLDISAYSQFTLAGGGRMDVGRSMTMRFRKGINVEGGTTLGLGAYTTVTNSSVSLSGGSTLLLYQQQGGTAKIDGSLTMAAGTTLAVTNVMHSGMAALAVNSISVPGKDESVNLVVSGSSVPVGQYVLLSSKTALPAGAVARFKLDMRASTVNGSPYALLANDNDIILYVGVYPPGIWTGHGDGTSFADTNNWLDCSVPGPGSTLDFSLSSGSFQLRVAGMEDVVYSTARFGTYTNRIVTVYGNLHFETLTNSCAFSIAKDSAVTVDGDVVLWNDDEYVTNLVSLVYKNEGLLDIRGYVRNSGYLKTYPCQAPSPGLFSVYGMVSGAEPEHILLSAANSPSDSVRWRIGAGGLQIAEGCAWSFFSKDAGATIVADGDMKIWRLGVYKPLTIVTEDESGAPHDVTVQDLVWRESVLTVTGSGRFIFEPFIKAADNKKVRYVIDGSTMVMKANTHTGAAEASVTLTNASSLVLSETKRGAATIGGVLAMEAGSSLVVSNFDGRLAPLSVNSLSFTGTGKARLVVTGPSLLQNGLYPLIESAENFPGDVIERFALDADSINGVTGTPPELVKTDKTLYLKIGDGAFLGPPRWIGGGSDGKFSNTNNWLFCLVPDPLLSQPIVFDSREACTAVNDLGDLTPYSITFAPGCAPTTVTGNFSSRDDYPLWIDNLSTNTHVFTGMVDFGKTNAIDVSIAYDGYSDSADYANTAPPGGHVVFKGGVRGTKPKNHLRLFGHYTMTEPFVSKVSGVNRTVVCADSSVVAPSFADISELYVLKGGSATALEDSDPGFEGALRISCWTHGDIAVSKTLTINPGTSKSGDFHPFYSSRTSTGRFFAGGLHFKLGVKGAHLGSDNKTADWYIGSDGIAVEGDVANGLYIWDAGDVARLHPIDSDFVVSRLDNPEMHLIWVRTAGSVLALCTDDKNGIGRTIRMSGDVKGAGSVAVHGKGRAVFDTRSSTFTGGLTVGDTATLELVREIAPGAGQVNMTGESTLLLAHPGPATPATNVLFGADSVLEFHFSDPDWLPTLQMPEGATIGLASKKVNLKITADEGVRLPVGREYTLVTGGMPTDGSVSVNIVDLPEWIPQSYVFEPAPGNPDDDPELAAAAAAAREVKAAIYIDGADGSLKLRIAPRPFSIILR